MKVAYLWANFDEFIITREAMSMLGFMTYSGLVINILRVIEEGNDFFFDWVCSIS